MKRLELVFKALSNINRLKIIKMLRSSKKMSVTDISKELKISFTAASRHLIILRNFSVLLSDGKDNHVFYYLNSELPGDFQKAIKLIP